MSTTTTNTSRTGATSATGASLAASSKFKTFATVFSISGPVVYCVIQYLNYPLFTYFPAPNRLAWGFEAPKAGEGPNMLWYGWSATTIIIAAILGIIAMMLPEHIVRKIPLSLVWIFPVLAIPYIVYALMPWWTLAAGAH